MKTIVFAQPDSPIVQKLQQEGKEFILAKDPIKTLKAMKQANKDNYTVIGDEASAQYVSYARDKLGYTEPEPEKKIEPVLDETLITAVNEGYKKKFEVESKKLEEEYAKKLSQLEAEHKNKLKELDKEKESLKKIKTALRREIYGK